jgi:hypothetical protein
VGFPLEKLLIISLSLSLITRTAWIPPSRIGREKTADHPSSKLLAYRLPHQTDISGLAASIDSCFSSVAFPILALPLVSAMTGSDDLCESDVKWFEKHSGSPFASIIVVDAWRNGPAEGEPV